jgi:hypothetical protein
VSHSRRRGHSENVTIVIVPGESLGHCVIQQELCATEGWTGRNEIILHILPDGPSDELAAAGKPEGMNPALRVG